MNAGLRASYREMREKYLQYIEEVLKEVCPLHCVRPAHTFMPPHVLSIQMVCTCHGAAGHCTNVTLASLQAQARLAYDPLTY